MKLTTRKSGLLQQFNYFKLGHNRNSERHAMMARITKRLIWGAWGCAFGLLPAGAQAQVSPASRALPACAQVGQQVTLTLNTGTAGPIPPFGGPGTADQNWTVVQPTSITPVTTFPVSAPALWLPNSLNPKWIQPDPSGMPFNFPLNTYVYSTQFTTPVDPILYTSITITGDFAADDTAIVKLNGVQIAQCLGGGTPTTWCFHLWKPIPAGVGWPTFNRFGAFLNTLTVEVKNTLAGSTSGLIVRAQVVAVCSKCAIPPPPPQPPCGGHPSTC